MAYQGEMVTQPCVLTWHRINPKFCESQSYIPLAEVKLCIVGMAVLRRRDLARRQKEESPQTSGEACLASVVFQEGWKQQS